MKKIFKSCTFWFAIASIVIIFLNLNGVDSKNMLLTFSNYPLYLILKAIGFTLIATSAEPNHVFLINHILLWFMWHFISYVCYGIIFDVVRVTSKSNK